MKKVIIFNEHQGTRVFDASTEELLTKACLKVLSERKTSTVFHYKQEPLSFNPSDIEQSYMNLTTAEIEALPQPLAENVQRTQTTLLLKKSNIDRANKDNAQWLETLNLLFSLPSEQQLRHTITLLKDTPYEYTINTAFWLLKERTRYVGEGFSIQTIETV